LEVIDGFTNVGRSRVELGFDVIVGFSNGAKEGFVPVGRSRVEVGLAVIVGFSKGANEGFVRSIVLVGLLVST